MSEGIDALIDAEGFAGYGRWNRILEIVAFKMDETGRCHAEYSIQKWCRLLGLKQKKLISFLELTENQLKTKVVYSENIIRIEIPNLLKKRDNYTKHLQAPKKELVSKDIDKDIDKEVDNKKKEKAIKGSLISMWILPEEIKPEVWQEFEDHRKTKKGKFTDTARTKNANILIEYNHCQQQEVVDATIANGWTGLFKLKGNGKGGVVLQKGTSLSKKDYHKGVGNDGEIL